MPVIAFANSKGGSGKTTSALLLGCELAEGAAVTLIDADPRHPISRWATELRHEPPVQVTVVKNESERTILDEIEEAAARDPFVIIDLEGVASRRVSYAVSQSDLVIIPMQEEQQDALAALDVIEEIHNDARALRRKIPYAVLFTQTKAAVKSRTQRHIVRQFRENPHIDTFQTEIVRRDAYSALFTTGGSHRRLSPEAVNNLDKAIANVHTFAGEVIAKLEALSEGREVA